MIAIPLFPLDAKSKAIVDFCVHLLSVEGFMELYEDNLKKYGWPGVAYEATETTYYHMFSRRRYADRETFYNALSRYKRTNS